MIKLFFVIMIMLVASNAMAYSPPTAPVQGGYVSDQTGKLSSEDIQALNVKIDRISKITKNEFGILLLQDMGGSSIEEVAGDTFHAWGIGKKDLDNGVLIVVAVKERKSRIEAGKGVEGEITDLQANDILKANLNPFLKKGDFAGGFNSTLDALSSLLESRTTQPIAISNSSEDSAGIALLVVLAFFGVFGGVIFLIISSVKRSKNFNDAMKHQYSPFSYHEENHSAPAVSSTRPMPHGFHVEPSKAFVYSPSTTEMIAAIETGKSAHQKSKNDEELSKSHKRERESYTRDEELKAEEAIARDDAEREKRDSSYSYDFGSSSDSSSSDFGGFDGGDSGGGGASSDW